MPSQSLCRASDTSFGPVVDSQCRSFDFTLFFEDVFLACVPSAVFIILGIIRVLQLVGRPNIIIRTYRLLNLIFGDKESSTKKMQTLYLILFTSEASLAAQLLRAFGTCVALCLSYLEYNRTLRPPLLINVYLFLVVLFDGVFIRSFWLASNSSSATALCSTVLAVHVIVLIAESLRKADSLITTRYRQTAAEETSSLWGLGLLIWVLPVLQQGFTRPLGLSDVPPVALELTSMRLMKRLQRSWGKVVDHSKRNQLPITLLQTYKMAFFSAVIPRLCLSAFTIMQPLLVDKITTYAALPETPETRDKGYGLIAASGIVYLGIAVSTAIYSRQTYRFIISIRGSLLAAVYSQTLKRRSGEMGTDTAITLMGTDVERISTSLRDIHEIWASPIDIGLALWLLERQLAVSCLMPVILSLACISMIIKVSKSKNRAQRAWIAKVELRIHATRQALSSIKSLKVLGLCNRVEEVIAGFRSTEIATSRKFRSLIFWEVLISSFPWLAAPAASFTLFTIISFTTKDYSLNSSQAFTALSLMTLITMPVWTFIQTLPAIVQCLGSFTRIQDYIGVHSSSNKVLVESERGDSSITDEGTIIECRDAFIRWEPSGCDMLYGINLSVPRGSFAAIMGPIGSGKTLLLETVLGETVVSSGRVSVHPMPIAYCAQTPWLVDTSVRGNIVDPLNFEPEWYRHVLWMCCLAEDVEALPEKDLTRIGGQGFMLSGGQKQRLALARAVYSGCEMVVLDDIFCGLDAANINKICERLLDRHKGYLRCRDITVILSTHNAKVAAFADDVFILKEGTVATYKPSASSTPSSGHQTSFPDDNESKSRPASPKQQASPSVDAEVSSDDNAPDPKQTVSRPVKDRSVYFYYLNSAGLGLSILYIVLVLVFAFSQNFSINWAFPALWLKWWSDASTESPDGAHWMYLGVFIALGLGAVIIGAASSCFNQDLELTDMTLPLAAINTTKALGACLLKMIILFVVANYMSLTVPPLLIVCYFLQRYYLRTSRQVRLLSIETKAPLYQHLSETLSGVSTIRAFRRQQWFERNNLLFVDDSQKCVYTLFMIQQWLTLAMDLLACGLVVLLMILIVFSRDSFDSGSSGTAIVTLMSFTQSLARLLKFWSLTESCLGAVSRIKTFAETVPSEAQSKHSDADSSFSMHEKVKWPSQGAIEFVNIVAAYRSHPVLKSVSMHIEPGDKVAICGRSGSGKSSLVLCLGGLLPIQSGTVQIDGVDLSNVCSEDILRRLSVVPQDPCFLPGTIRLNIDPDEALSEAALEGVLKATHLSAIVQNMGGLDAELEPGLWSAGQGQLMALARAMARRSRILILDEAMGRVDAATQSLMERIVASHFNDCTILSIVHRYENISAFDKIALFEDGVLVEFDRPESLLSQETRFRALYTSSQN
ncbi:hypothetical protein ASPNIDRAFT_50413 [Aspergillus niger ATCC 1015]|uniref:Uncharacterized protein n=1 Tax=Aspergillus niger (strain ATCC 1015 / CBS 113.46 / FGSC A1144 / LSHB Ac4 / NCTC 3858a / NRRL 328 / USDA 3528.7) TaxID=380704 RepID=G3XTZ4_ASPNA|nr:hypothetical protein ASPNIDRAFT_50413 [Aspergillus niger ATCC 1015]